MRRDKTSGFWNSSVALNQFLSLPLHYPYHLSTKSNPSQSSSPHLTRSSPLSFTHPEEDISATSAPPSPLSSLAMFAIYYLAEGATVTGAGAGIGAAAANTVVGVVVVLVALDAGGLDVIPSLLERCCGLLCDGRCCCCWLLL